MAITPDMLVELIESTVAARVEAEDKMRDLRRQMDELDVECSQLTQEEQGYRLALARRFPDAAAASTPQQAPRLEVGLFALQNDIVDQPRSDAVESAIRVLTQDGEPATPAAIEAFLHERGRSDSRDAIGAALAYLNRTDRVVNVARGQWRLKESP